MTAHFIELFTHPGHAWRHIRDEETQHPRHYFMHLALLALIPVIALYIGTTSVGWSLTGVEDVRLSTASAAFSPCVLNALQTCAKASVMRAVALAVIRLGGTSTSTGASGMQRQTSSAFRTASE